jgi:hypothetical protein
MRRPPWQGPSILVVGSVHIDTVAERDETEIIDVPGTVVQSIGGGAYNVAVNLGRHRRATDGPVYLLAFVPKRSALTAVIRAKLRTLGVSSSYITFKDKYEGETVSLGGFVGVRSEKSKDMIRAATQTTIEGLSPFAKDKPANRYRKVIKRSSCVAADTNVNTTTIQRMLSISDDLGKPLFIGIVSEGKATRHSDLYTQEPPPKGPVYLVSGRPKEICKILETCPQAGQAAVAQFRSALERGETKFDMIHPNQICEWARARHVVITPHRGRECCFIFSSGGTSFHFNPISEGPPKDGNFTGLGDAIFAGLIRYYACLPGDLQDMGKPWDLSKAATQKTIVDTVNDFTCDVIRVKGATPHSVISFTEEDIPMRSRVLRLVNRTIKFAQDWSTIITLIMGALLAWLGISIAGSTG